MEAIQVIPDWRAAADEIWAMFKETDRKMQETDRKMQETDRKMQETRELINATGRQMKDTDKRVGELSNRFGEIVEYMVAPNLKEKFREIGLSFQETSNNKVISGKDGTFLFEIDILLENGDKALLVETKSKPSTEDVNDHVERLKKMRARADLKGDRRKFLAAIAGAVMTEDVRNYALKQGFFVVEPSGETFTILQPAGQPREW